MVTSRESITNSCQDGKSTKNPIPEDNTRELSENKKKRIKKVVGSILYYAWAVHRNEKNLELCLEQWQFWAAIKAFFVPIKTFVYTFFAIDC